MHHITILDGHTLNPGDLDWGPVLDLATTQVFERSTPEEVLERSRESTILIVNKVRLDRKILDELPQLQYICVSATGYNNIDLQAAQEKGIPVSNVAGYSTPAVAQHVFALLLAYTNRVQEHAESVREGSWSRSPDFCYWLAPVQELGGKTIGIYGLGQIGQAVARLALAFGMEVLAHHKHPERDRMEGVRFVSLEQLFEAGDVVTLHAPLHANNQEIVNRHLLQRMKPDALLVNTSRGGLINEHDLAVALDEGWLGAALLDVLSSEPPPADHPLTQHPKCWITPHLAWASQQSRQRLLLEVVQNIQAFMNGTHRNPVSLPAA
ncbi:MAG: D-2-hydroxyacid dehydrogenase [Phaeodactylibacter sp.]|nr:D-2-hydroxyacid dehydrogenase [Phaeodactylibacter sp.]